MKPIKLLAIVLFTCLMGLCKETYAQNDKDSFVWAPVGATWHYGGPLCIGPPFNTNCSYFTIQSVKDTFFKAKNARILEWRGKNNNLRHREIMYNDGDSVFYYDTFKKRFQLLYDFGLKVGDTLILNKDSFPLTNSFTTGLFVDVMAFKPFGIIVDSIDTTKVQGKPLKKIYTSFFLKDLNLDMLWPWTYGGPIIEGIGCTYLMFGRRSIKSLGGMVYGGLRCYQDSNLFYKPYDHPCDYIDTSAYEGVKQKRSKYNNIKIFPNPFSKGIEIKFEEKVHMPITIQLINGKGQIVKSLKSDRGHIKWKLNNLKEGIYLIKITSKNHNFIQKIIKK